MFCVEQINPPLGLSQTQRVALLTLLQFSEWMDRFPASVSGLLVGVVLVGRETLRAPVPSKSSHGLLQPRSWRF